MLAVPALVSHNAGMQYTIRDIPPRLDKALRDRARTEGKSINQIAIEAFANLLGFRGEPQRRRDLSDIAGTWVEDEACAKALEEQDRIDPELWR